MLVPTAKNDRFRFFRRGSVVEPCGRVDTRPYAGLAVVGGRVGTRPYEALRFGTLAQPISILPQGDRKFSIFNYTASCYAVFRAAACFSRRSVLY